MAANTEVTARLQGAARELGGASRVAVPPEAPWPEDAWGINLGTSVNKIRGPRGVLRQGPADRVAELNRMGFIWNINEEHWQLILDSLHVYKELHGDIEGAYFVRGAVRKRGPRTRGASTSGTRLAAIRSHKIYVKDRPDRVAELNRMGFIWDVYEEQWQRILDSLHAYKELHRNLEVPREFAVPPEAPWPEDAWGINLGSRVVTIRNQECHIKDRPDRVAELNRMGFIWNINEGALAAATLDSLHAYKELHGDLEVPFFVRGAVRGAVAR